MKRLRDQMIMSFNPFSFFLFVANHECIYANELSCGEMAHHHIMHAPGEPDILFSRIAGVSKTRVGCVEMLMNLLLYSFSLQIHGRQGGMPP